MKTFLRVILY